MIIGKFTITPNLKNIHKRLHWEVFCKNIFQIRTYFRSDQIKSRKYFSIHHNQNFRNFNIKHLQWSKADLPKEKKDSKERYSTNFSSSRPEVYSKKKVSLKNLPPVYWHITKIHDIHHVQNL